MTTLEDPTSPTTIEELFDLVKAKTSNDYKKSAGLPAALEDLLFALPSTASDPESLKIISNLEDFAASCDTLKYYTINHQNIQETAERWDEDIFTGRLRALNGKTYELLWIEQPAVAPDGKGQFLAGRMPPQSMG